MKKVTTTDAVVWLLLIYQLPAKPAYFRVKIGRKLAALGAIPIKNAVHALPLRNETNSAFRGLKEDIAQGGGEALVCQAQFVDGLTDAEVRALFDADRDADYEELADEARVMLDSGEFSKTEVLRLNRRREEISKIDFFAAHGRQTADSVLAELERRLPKHSDVRRTSASPKLPLLELKNRVWVTRRDIHVDRIASAWLIRHFIDNTSVFKFVDGKNYKPAPGELRFDMSDAEFTHEGSDCTFETLLRHADLNSNPALCAIAEIVHDLDLEDGRFGRPETMGLGAMIAGICAKATSDEERLILGGEGLNQFYSYFCAK